MATGASTSNRKRNYLIRGCEQKIAYFSWKVDFFQEAADEYFMARNELATQKCEESAMFYRKARQNAIEMKKRFEALPVEVVEDVAE